MQPPDTHEIQVAHTSTNPVIPKVGGKPLHGRISRWLNRGAAVLIIVAIVGTSLALFTSHHAPAAGSNAGRNGSTPISDHGPGLLQTVAHVQAGGLEFSMRMTPGPYFLSELFAADLTLTNHTSTTFTLGGLFHANVCGSALFLKRTGGAAPNYQLPVVDDHSCPGGMHTEFKPTQTFTIHLLFALSSSGDLTLQPNAYFEHTEADPNGGQRIAYGPGPFDGHWPSIHIHVSSQIPADRLISLQPKGTQVVINAPAAARPYLYYIYNVSCDAFQGGTVGTGNYMWEPITTTLLHEPDCGDYGNQHIRWYYAVSAPGYAIASGQEPAK